ncbi:MAG: hypothetical protein OQK09_00460 [Colwellia sp.]|nr:hypothetical protein [Colwellia sp.]MCW8863525.1 hypothetical protein [Colwellia sp.]MCW9079959.1 hypothetical protein [Colwellia sp.]
MKSKTATNQSVSKGTLCNYCHYRRQKEDNAPDWECPRCQRVYHKVPLAHEKIPKNKYIVITDVEPSFFSRIPLELTVALALVLSDIIFGWLTNWQTLTTKLTPTEHITIVVSCLAIIWSGERLTNIIYQYLPIRTGIMEHLARKNEHEEKLIIKHMPRLVVLVAWAFLLWFIFKVSWL